jgi:hypothetical protein
MNITDFLLKRIAEDEAAALQEDEDYAHTTLLPTYDSEHQMRWSTARVLAECAAKRSVIGWWVDGLIGYVRVDDELTNPLLPLAAVYKDHPDYKQDWAV